MRSGKRKAAVIKSDMENKKEDLEEKKKRGNEWKIRMAVRHNCHG